MDNIKYSIIIPHHNTPDLLTRCLDTIPDIEQIQVIVVDDNSDSTKVDFDAMQKHGRKYTQVVLTKEGKGAGYARNVGLGLAKGKWLVFADSDDFFVDDFVASLDEHYQSESDMILFKAKSVDSETLEPAHRDENINNCIDKVLMGSLTPLQASLHVHSPWCRMVRHELVSANMIKFDEVLSSNDTMFTTKCGCLAKSIAVSSDYLYVCTYRKGSLWDARKSNPENHLCRLKVDIDRNNYVRQFGLPQEPVQGYVIKAMSISFKTFLRALGIVLSRGALFQGIGKYFK